MDLEQWKDGGRYWSHNGHRIFYRLDGSGQPLLLLHGYPTFSWDYHLIHGALSARFLTIAPDFIGFGFSDKPQDYNYSLVDQAALIEGLLTELRIDRVNILTHDYGVSVAQELLAREQDRTRSRKKGGLAIETVCFLNGGIFPEGHRPRFIQQLLQSPVGWIVAKLINEAAFRTAFLEVFGPATKPSAELTHQLWQVITHNKGHEISHRLMTYIAERQQNRERWVNALMNTRARLRFINGSLDPVSGRHMADIYTQLILNPDVVHLPEVGHYPQMEAPEAVLEAFLAFVEKRPEET
jgi:pimeloyl-ACP methyl ester carboxylesterase